jgi:NifB/MoaA-like Fe-S oxidoreductase
MRQLPEGLRPSLTLRDDDYRLSFLIGTFVTLTNLEPEDEDRIIAQRITPLHVSLQVSNPEVRRSLIGRNAAHGIAAFDRLLQAGIEAHCQIVLVPGVNDGEYLTETLEWAYARPGILDIGIVPLGYTKHQERFDGSFNDPLASKRVLDDVEPFRRRALAERGTPWVFPADEFYSNAYHADIIGNLPPASHYGDFELFEDGIGIIRSTIDDWYSARDAGVVDECARALRETNTVFRLIVGEAQRDFLDQLIASGPLRGLLEPFYVKNEYFGGNVNVTGLLVGRDVSRAVAWRNSRDQALGEQGRVLYGIQQVVFNDDGVMLDDMRLEDMQKAAGSSIAVVSCIPVEYLSQIAELARA